MRTMTAQGSRKVNEEEILNLAQIEMGINFLSLILGWIPENSG